MSDSISRQAAIDEIEKWRNAFIENNHYASASDAKFIRGGIKHLPSAQPEIIRCKDCVRHGFNKYGQNTPTYCFYHMIDGWQNDDFCSYAERRTDE